MVDYVTKDSGNRQDYESGMRRDTQEGKPRFDLILAPGVPYEDQLLTRFASLMARGAVKYGEQNWALANSEKEYKRFKGSALRHMMQWFLDESDKDQEDHAVSVFFNIMAAECVKAKLSPKDS